MTPYGLWLLILMDLCCMAASTSVALTVLLSQTRIFFAMACDGLLPEFFAKICSRTKSPWISIIISGMTHSSSYSALNICSYLGAFCAVISGVFPIDILGETTSISALITYLFVHIEVIVVGLSTDVLYSLNYMVLFRCVIDIKRCLEYLKVHLVRGLFQR